LLIRWNFGTRTSNRLIRPKSCKTEWVGAGYKSLKHIRFVNSQETSSNKRFESSKNGSGNDISYNQLNNIEEAVQNKSLGQEGETQ